MEVPLVMINFGHYRVTGASFSLLVGGKMNSSPPPCQPNARNSIILDFFVKNSIVFDVFGQVHVVCFYLKGKSPTEKKSADANALL
jgi:hypothetical protein